MSRIGFSIKKCRISLLCLLFLSIQRASGQQLPFHHYDTRTGLADNRVTCIYQDSRGYLWFGGWEGLSRFDGYRFTDYGVHDGLPDPIVNAIGEDRQGRLWVAINNGGMARLADGDKAAKEHGEKEPAHPLRGKFYRYPVGDSVASNVINGFLFDDKNTLWCVTDAGIFHSVGDLDNGKFELVMDRKPLPQETFNLRSHEPIFQDKKGRIWIANADDLVEVFQNHLIIHPVPDKNLPINAISETVGGDLLVATSKDVFEFAPPDDNSNKEHWETLSLSLPPQRATIISMIADSKGAIWVGTWGGLIKYENQRESFFAGSQGLNDDGITSLAEDRERNLWIGTTSSGAYRLSDEGVVTYRGTGPLLLNSAALVLEGRNGQMYVSSLGQGVLKLSNGQLSLVPGSESVPFLNIGKRLLQDNRGDWWVGTRFGLYRFKGPDLQFEQGEKFGPPEGLPAEPVFNGPGIYEDSSGKIWVGMRDHNVYWFDPAQNKKPFFHRLPLGDSWSEFGIQFLVDKSGAVWIGSFGALERVTNGQRYDIKPTQGLPQATPRALFQDSRGWIWIGLRYGGVSVVKDPAATPLRFVNYSTVNGLANDAVWSITEDNNHQMYFGTDRGLDRLDVTTGIFHHFTSVEDLTTDTVNDCVKDKQGNIWIVTNRSLSRFTPDHSSFSNTPPVIYLSQVRVAGDNIPMDERGALHVALASLPTAKDNILIEYVGLNFREDRELKYQYKLEGAGGDWSVPSDQRTVNFAHLAPGKYKFLVRAINEDGTASPEPATLEFHINPPFWQQWWFISLVFAIGAMTIYTIHRYRVRHLIELERVRTRIATDLHDDIGSALSQIAILSEVASRQVSNGDSPLTGALATIATT
ncbi:MAG TPA: two-component regulator propeller domain-containing protein, partial [Blastocatellia bacterium]|nr:two-component regulator propeller domain-containing protein [Blastocatellia bacterium]